MAADHRIIIDTDPGQDDAVAILLALASPEIEVLGITAVAGNVPLALTERNARKICELARRTDIGVFAGAPAPLCRRLVTAEAVHGRTGLDGPELPEPEMPLQPVHAADFIVETLRREPAGTVTLATLGPLTNLALALRLAPEIGPRVKRIVMMGGGYFEQGNTTPSAEFNIYVDPHAADKALTTRRRVVAIRDLDTPVARATAEMLAFYERFDERKYGTDGGPLHDPCVIAWLLKPELFSGRQCNVTIETGSELTMGATVVDWWGVTDRLPNADVMRDIDADAFFALLTERLARL
jgi:purine nucleosidase